MGKDTDAKRGRSRKNSYSSSSSLSSSESESSRDRRRKKRRRSSSRRDSSRHRSSRHRHEKDDERRGSSRKHKERSRHKERKKRDTRGTPSDSSSSSSDDASGAKSPGPVALVRLVLDKYPYIASDLKQLLHTIDSGEGVDVRGISDKALVNLLKKLFFSLKLTRRAENGIFLLPPKCRPTLEVIGSEFESNDNQFAKPGSPTGLENECAKNEETADVAVPTTGGDGNPGSSTSCRRKVIGPEMPSRELLDAAAKLTEAETLFREAELDFDNDLVIGPPPPALIAEVASANEAERFEEVARIAESEADKPYDVLGVNWKTPFDTIKKKYWKLSLIVHPDKCSHPQAHQAFVRLNQAFKDLQDPDKRNALDEGIKLKEEQEKFKVELKALREAAQWRRLQGISLEGDDELLAVEKEVQKRDEWMTTLPPERKPGVTMQSTAFSKTTKEGRGDTSMWTDTPLDKAEKAKQNYLEAYNRTIALADTDEIAKKPSSDAELVDKYNSSKRSVPLVQKHQEQISRPKKKSKQPENREWEGQHPWKPWDREKDLTAGRAKVNLDPENMGQGLTNRFSAGTFQRNFL